MSFCLCTIFILIDFALLLENFHEILNDLFTPEFLMLSDLNCARFEKMFANMKAIVSELGNCKPLQVSGYEARLISWRSGVFWNHKNFLGYNPDKLNYPACRSRAIPVTLVSLCLVQVECTCFVAILVFTTRRSICFWVFLSIRVLMGDENPVVIDESCVFASFVYFSSFLSLYR